MADRDKRWAEFVAAHRGKVRSLVLADQQLSILCGKVQAAGFPCSLSADTIARIAFLTERWNRIGRIISGVELGKYGVYDGPAGDLSVYAPASMQREAVQDEIYLGIAWVPALGIALIISALLSVYVFKDDAEAQRVELANKLLDADRNVLDSGDRDLQARWSDWKKQNADQIKSAAVESPGLVDRLLGSGSGNMVAIGLLGLAALWAISRGSRAAA